MQNTKYERENIKYVAQEQGKGRNGNRKRRNIQNYKNICIYICNSIYIYIGKHFIEQTELIQLNENNVEIYN